MTLIRGERIRVKARFTTNQALRGSGWSTARHLSGEGPIRSTFGRIWWLFAIRLLLWRTSGEWRLAPAKSMPTTRGQLV